VKLNSSISAVVTGGASGLGAATARMLASHGVKVALFDLNTDLGELLAAEIGGVFCKVNVTSTPEVDAAFAKSRAAIGQERILVNCAGVGGSVKTVSRDKQTREIKEYPLDNFERIIQVNLIGTFRCITKSAAGMLTVAAYTASKAGVVGLTLTVARDLSSEAIRVNTILPGIFDTPLLQRAPERVKETLAAQVPFPRRLGRPEEYAQLAYTMITNGYFNGEDVRLDGAIRMTPR
jgi:NAD(P)-dependent dehydrogenase (short-subunit alcohol dehydrogenase family)